VTATFDIVVVGSGVAGMTAAVAGARLGQSILLVEKTPLFGGTSAFSGGVAWIACNHHMNRAGIEDSPEAAETFLRAALGGNYDHAKMAAFIAAAPEMLRFMETHSDVRFKSSTLPDYRTDCAEWRRCRSIHTEDYDGGRLGAALATLRTPLDALVLFGSMQISGSDITPLRKAFRSSTAFLHTWRLLSRFLVNRLIKGRGTRLVNGNALMGRLLQSALDSQVTLWNQTAAQRLIVENGRVLGVIVQREGQEIEIAARKAVVLATGGFGANAKMRARFLPFAAHHISMQPEGNVGDGIRMALEIGAVLNVDNGANAIWSPISIHARPDGRVTKYPHIMIDRYMPGSIAVGPAGRRFVNEADSYQTFVSAMHRDGIERCHLIADHAFVRKYGLGLARPFPFPLRKWVKCGYLVEARSLDELARKIAVDSEALRQTVDSFNRYAAAGFDPEFHRGSDEHSRYRGDADNRPNPSLGRIANAPFYALALHTGHLSTVAGLETDEYGRVLDKNGGYIEGLYAAGVDMNSAMRGEYPAGGASIGAAMTFSYIAVRHIVGQLGTPDTLPLHIER
jgi:succinate dehydrogenase/fumarate reductase flavoprotein subunit